MTFIDHFTYYVYRATSLYIELHHCIYTTATSTRIQANNDIVHVSMNVDT